MKQQIICISPKSKEAHEFFTFFMRNIHSCKVLEREDNRILLTPIKGKYKFWIQKKNDANWEVVK